MKKIYTCLTFLLFLGIAAVQAATVVTTDGTNAANLVSIDIDGTLYSGSNLIGVDLTAFNMTNSTQTFQIVPDGVSKFEGAAASGLLEDGSLTTGYAALVSDSFSFLTPVVNRAGADLFIFEFSSTESAELNLTINGNTVDVGSSPFTATGVSVIADLHRSETGASTISILEAITDWGNTSNIASAPIGYHAVDLDDYGVANGASISTLTIAGSGDWDITGVVGLAVIPEPSSFFLVILGLPLLGWGLRKRRS